MSNNNKMTTFEFKLNGRKYSSKKKVLTGAEILTLAGLEPDSDFELLQKFQEREFEFIRPDEAVDLSQAGLEKFRAKHYKEVEYSVNDNRQVTTECDLTVTEILETAGYATATHFLKEVRGNAEISYEDDPNVSIRIRNKMKFIACEREPLILIVNAERKPWTKETISFTEVIVLAYGQVSTNPNTVYTVTYRNGPNQNPEGAMDKGDVVVVKHKMEFDVSFCNKS